MFLQHFVQFWHFKYKKFDYLASYDPLIVCYYIKASIENCSTLILEKLYFSSTFFINFISYEEDFSIIFIVILSLLDPIILDVLH